MKFRSAFAAAAFAGLQFLGGQAHAAAIGTAAFSNLQIQMIDLKPDDGIAPSLTLSDVQGTKRFEVWGRMPGETETWPRRLIDVFNTDPGTSSFEQLGVSGKGDVGINNGSLVFGSDGLYARSANWMHWDFVLSPFTRLVVTADYSASEQTENGVHAYGHGGLAAAWNDVIDWDTDWSQAFTSSYLSSIDETLLVALESGETEKAGWINSEVYVTVFGNRVPVFLDAVKVPEPGSLGLLGLGLAALAVRRRRTA